jgi:lysophospholipase L1-like esterase
MKYNSYNSFLVKGILSFLGMNDTITPTFKGFAPKNSSFKKDEHNLKRLRELQSDSSSIHLFRKKLVTTKEFLHKYKTDSVKFFLVWAPEYKGRFKIISSIVTPVKEDIVQIVSEMPNVYFLDFSENPISLKKEYFYDTFHLNERGATLFSTRLSIEIDSILKN